MVERCETAGIGVVGWLDDDYPSRLRTIPRPPAVLYYRGTLAATAHERAVAIVGTRHPTPAGVHATGQISDAFASAGWAVVSGLAVGVDALAHQAALAAGAPTIAVLANGLDSVYPAANRQLAAEIVAQDGLLVSETPPGERARAGRLVARDRLQSGLADVTVVCQAGVRSGTMHTARFALEQGRPLYASALTLDGEEPQNEQDTGLVLLLRSPARTLWKALPAWRNARASLVDRDEPVALPLDATSLPATVAGPPLAKAEASGRLFED